MKLSGEISDRRVQNDSSEEVSLLKYTTISSKFITLSMVPPSSNQKNLVKKILSDESCIIADGATGPWPRWRSLQTLLSTGNYFVPVREFCHSIEPFRDVEKLTACTIAAVYIWLCSGYSLKVVPGLEYVHRIHDKSLSRKQANANKAMANAFCNMLVEDRGLDVFHNNRLMIQGLSAPTITLLALCTKKISTDHETFLALTALPFAALLVLRLNPSVTPYLSFLPIASKSETKRIMGTHS